MIARLRFVLALILGILVLFTGRLLYLQAAMAEQLLEQSEGNFLEHRRIAPLRGRILARDGTVLADNRIAVDLMYWGGDIDHWARIRHLLKIEAEPEAPDLTDVNERQSGKVLAWNIPDELWPAIEELVAGQPNLYLRERVERTYPTNLAAHLVGYTANADPDTFPGYELNDLVGLTGLESSYQEVLYGLPGLERVQVNNRRVVLNRDVIVPAVPGQNIVTTLDPKVQNLAETSLAGALEYVNKQRAERDLPLEQFVRGAIIAMNPKTGDILAMASSPSFDQNVFTHRPSDPEKISALLNDSEFTLSNRAVEAYPPASTFKVTSSSALLEYGFISPQTRFTCSQAFYYGGIKWENWTNYDRGAYDNAEAIADSCNTFYWRAASSTPNFSSGWAPYVQRLTARARELGYGEKVGIGLPEEKAGRVPDDTWSRNRKGYPWRPGDTLNLVIGQGDMLATPLQNAQVIATMALSGLQVKPRLVLEVGNREQATESKQIDGRYWQNLQEGMRRMITDYGSNWILGPAANFPVAVAGKTGTAQNPKGDGYDHTWFMGYGPLEDPELVVVVFVEYGDRSTGVAVPTARDFLAGYWGVE